MAVEKLKISEPRKDMYEDINLCSLKKKKEIRVE